MSERQINQNILELQEIMNRSENILKNQHNSKTKEQLTMSKVKLSEKINSNIQFKDVSYQIISYLASLQNYFKQLVKTTEYKDSEITSLYWDIVVLKERFKGINNN